MRWSVRAFLRYLHLKGLTRVALADCVPSIRQWKFASLPTYLSAAEVQKVLDGCDRTIVVGRRDYAILMLLAKLGLRAGEVATLTLGDIDWRCGQMLIHAKGRKRARLPMPPDVGAAIVAYLQDRYGHRRVGGCFCARRRLTSALYPVARLRRSPRTPWNAPASVATPTTAPTSSDTVLPPNFSDPGRLCQRLANCWDMRAMTPRVSMRKWISLDSAH